MTLINDSSVSEKKKSHHTYTKPSTDYCRVRMRIILILCCMYMSLHGDSASCVLLSISYSYLTSNFEYE